jgi:transposase
MIFPVWTLKFVKSTFGIEHDQRVIIKFLWKDRVDTRQIAAILQAQFAEHVYQLQTVQFWITEIRRDRQDLHDEIRNGRPPLDDLDDKILAILDKSLFESAHSIAKRLLVVYSTVLQHLHESLGFKSFHLH